jgi:hypothetical protein
MQRFLKGRDTGNEYFRQFSTDTTRTDATEVEAGDGFPNAGDVGYPEKISDKI